MNTMATSTSVGALPEPPRASPAAHAHHNRDLALQKYLLLHEQHESLRQHLDELRPLPPSRDMAAPTATAISPVGSPTRNGSVASFSSSSGQASPYHSRSSSLCGPFRRSSLPSRIMMCNGSSTGSELETVPDETTLAEVAIEEAKLCDVNEGIKRALTELLNCEAVRGDRAFRTWVQCRLMDTERELRSGRRRRSAPEA
ncbi:hypothetical protein B0H63DRAFT_403071 [Podospora didyma]|uniref:Uncharacterized protein n=1 Tax=Podospora didyma TaxID=330526 RepID=A0AAE0K5K7_9PEZI|nr:hypothetical protein B0H63DRAFT_403071 [Podospora didyma]